MNQDFNKLAGSVIDIYVDNHKDMAEHAKLWNIDEYQIQDGPFIGSIKAILTPFTQLGEVSRSSGVVIKGNGPKDCYMFGYFYLDGKGTVTCNGLPIRESELLVNEDTDQIDVMSSNGHNSITITIQKEYFDRKYKDFFGHSFKYDKGNKRIQLKENIGQYLKDTFIRLIHYAMEDRVKLQKDVEFLQNIEKRIIDTLFQSINPLGKINPVLDCEKSASILRTYLELSYREDLSVHKIAHDLHMSDRTIRKGFKTLFGMSPKKYLISYRLGKVHNALLLTRPNHTTTVESIANEHGFYHMGHFGCRYHKMFKEHPSDTLLKEYSS